MSCGLNGRKSGADQNSPLFSDLNSCGVAWLIPLIDLVQNQYDQSISNSAILNGVPGALLKLLLLNETQLYPLQPLNGANVFSVGQISRDTAILYLTQLVADLGLQDTTVDQLIRDLDGFCNSACGDQNGIDNSEVSRAIEATAFLLATFKSYVNQQSFINALQLTCSAISQALKSTPNDNVLLQEQPYCLTDAQAQTLSVGWNSLSVDDQWKLTMGAYNGGAFTIQISIMNAARNNATSFDWATVSGYMPATIPGTSISTAGIIKYVRDVSQGTPGL